MTEIIVLTREQYIADLEEAAKRGAMIALKQGGVESEWLTTKEAMELLRIKSTNGLSSYRKRHKIYGKEKVRMGGKNKLYNRKYLVE